MTYNINTIYPCIQGEGCLTGTPMILVRFQGCSVGCPWCDTKETWELDLAHKVYKIDRAISQKDKWGEIHLDDIVSFIKGIHPPPYWILLTGGEPAEQELTSFIDTLQDEGYKIAIETSATATLTCDTIDWVCVSPKIDMPGGKKILSSVLEKADEIKFVVGKKADILQLENLIKDNKLKDGIQICLQPISQSKKATEICIENVIKNGWRLSTQTHKFLNLP